MGRSRLFSDEERKIRKKIAALKWYLKDYATNRSKYLLKQKKYASENPDKRRNTMKQFKRNNPYYYKNKKLKERYGISGEEFNKMNSRQHGKCLICGFKPTERLCVDHNHETGRIRGLLCKPCNLAISHFKESETILRKAIQYLGGYNESNN